MFVVCLKTYFDITHGWFKSTNDNSITLLHACAVDPLRIAYSCYLIQQRKCENTRVYHELLEISVVVLSFRL